MNELIRIELKKLRFKKEIRNLVIVNLVLPFIALPLILVAGGAFENAHFLVSMFIQATFMIWQSVLISGLIVEEFKTKTMMQLYTYPIKRSSLIIAKVGLILVMILVFSLVTSLVQHSLFAVLSLAITNISYSLSITAILGIVVTSISTVLLAMMTLTVGMWLESTVAPVVTAFVLTAIMGNFNGLSLANNLIFMIVMGIIGAGCVMMSIRDMLTKDLII